MNQQITAPSALAATWVTPEVRSSFESLGHWTSETWLSLVLARTEEDPDAVAVVDQSGALTRGEVLQAASRLAGHLRREGVAAGDVVTLVLPNWREFVVIHTAVGMIGGVVNPLLPKVGVTEMRHIMRTAGTRYVFAAAAGPGDTPWTSATAAAEGLDSVLGVIAVRGDDDLYARTVADAGLELRRADFAEVDAREWDTVTFTSGTEALPKGVVHSHQTTMFGLRAYIGGVLQLDVQDCVFMPSPICHASGIQWGLRTAIYAGAPLILQDRWDPAVALELIDRHRCTYTLAATTFIVDLVAAKARSTDAASGTSLRFVASGGAAIPRHLVAEVREAFSAELMAVFGASETYVTTATRPGSPEHILATDGEPLPGVEVAIMDEVGQVLPPGAEGEIVTRGPQTFLGYLGDQDLTRRAFHGQWYRFGDLGRIDEDGMLHVTGRIKDIVIRGGENISVREVEELLVQHPDISSAAVVGYPDDRLGERCCAVVVPAGGRVVDLALTTSFLLERGLAKFKLPERLVIVEAMPMTATGKVKKADLRRFVADSEA